MPFMQAQKVTFNGNDLTLNGLISVRIDQKLSPNIFATSKTINTAKAMYGRRNITTGYDREPLQFDLTFSSLGTPFTQTLCETLYQIFDVPTYKKLTFGTATVGNLQIYFNAIPMVGKITEMYNFANDNGYFTIPFVCDAGHGWVDQTYHFDRVVGENSGVPWVMNNPSNVKDRDGFCRVYPYITINLPEFDPQSTLKNYHIGFWLSTEQQANAFRLSNISQNQTLLIDNENKQMYSSAGDNLLTAMGNNIRFFYLEQGQNTVLHETYVGDQTISSSYGITFDLACPYMW
jgi:hypothetical protein